MSRKTNLKTPKVKNAKPAKLKKAKAVDAVSPTEASAANAETTPIAGGKMSGLAAAAKVLKDAGEPLNVKQIIERVFAAGLWSSEGKTPHSTIYAAMMREANVKGDASRFRRVARGKFTAVS